MLILLVAEDGESHRRCIMCKCGSGCVFFKILALIVIIGALNWGLVGVAGYNLVDHLFGVGSIAARAVYTIVGLSGVALLVSFFKKCSCCCDSTCKKDDTHV